MRARRQRRTAFCGLSRGRGVALGAVLAAGACQPDPPPCDAVVGNLCGVAGTGELGFDRDGQPPEQTDLFLVSSARRGPDGLLYIMDFNNQRLRRVDEDGLVQTVAGNGFHAFADITATADTTPLENPIDFRFDAQGRIVFVSYHDPRVIRIEADGTLTSLAGAPDGLLATEGDEGDGGPATEALFIQLDGMAIAPDGSIYVSDSLADRVRHIDAQGVIRTVAGTGDPAYTGDGGPGVEAALHWPTALQLDPQGNLYIADTRNHVIRRLSSEGIIETIAGDGTQGFAGDGGPALQARFDQPYGLALDDDGTLFVADRANFRVRAIGPDGIIDTIAGVGTEGLTGDGGPALEAELGYTARLAMDDDGLLVADQSNSVVRRLVLR